MIFCSFQFGNLIKISFSTDGKLSKTITSPGQQNRFLFFLFQTVCKVLYSYFVLFHLKEHPVKHCSSWILQNDPSDLTNLNLNFKFYWALWSRIGQIENYHIFHSSPRLIDNIHPVWDQRGVGAGHADQGGWVSHLKWVILCWSSHFD